VANVAQHAFNLRSAKVDGIMLGWTLGGCPSPNLDVYKEMGRPEEQTVSGVLQRVAEQRFGAALAPAVVEAWTTFSTAFKEYPFGGGLYSGPQQMGPANPLWAEPTKQNPTMVGLPFDGLDVWRGPYPAEVFVGQFEKIANGFDAGIAALKAAAEKTTADAKQRAALDEEIGVAETCAIHFRSVENQSRFVMDRTALSTAASKQDATAIVVRLKGLVKNEMELAKRLYAIQTRDSRIGFEASNHYYYVPLDLVAKVIDCRYLLDQWLPAEQAK
jgi:hypothetical protein